MFDSKPAASSAQIVVNIASLPSTLTVLCGAILVRSRGAGTCVAGGVCVCTCAGIGAGAGACPVAGNAITAHNPINTIGRRSFFMPFAVVLTRASRYFDLRLSRLSVWKGMPGSGRCPLSTLRHLVNLQARNALRQGFPLFSILCEPSANSAPLRYPCFSLWTSTGKTRTTLAPCPSIC